MYLFFIPGVPSCVLNSSDISKSCSLRQTQCYKANATCKSLPLHHYEVVIMSSISFSQLLPLADTVLELYANHTPASHMIGHRTNRSNHMTCHVISLLLDTWLCGYSSEKALNLLDTQLKSTTKEEWCVCVCVCVCV